MTVQSATAQSRTLRVVECKVIMRAEMSAAGVSLRDLGEVLGVTHRRVECMLDRDDSSALRASDLGVYTRAVGPALLEHEARIAGYSLQPLVDGDHEPAEVMSVDATAMREAGEAVAHVAASAADGQYTRAEAVEDLAEVDQAIRALLHLRAIVAAKAER